MKQYIITPAMGKRMIGIALPQHPAVKKVLEKGTLVIIAGTTNGYIAEEILNSIGQSEKFTRAGFRRGLVTPIGVKAPDVALTRDIIIRDGVLSKEKSVFEVVDELKIGDMIMKGANAFDPRRQAAVHIGSTTGGTIMAAMSAIIGRRVQLLVPVGLEKRILEDVNNIVNRCNAPTAEGPRLMALPGEIFTEIDAIKQWTGADATLISAGGVYGAEGAVRLGIEGTPTQMEETDAFIMDTSGEIAFFE